MPVLGPVKYEVVTKAINEGNQWVTVMVENVGDEEITGLSVELHSLNTYNLDATGTGEYIPSLRPNEEAYLNFQVRARLSTDIYFVFDGSIGEASFNWQSPYSHILVGEPSAEIASFFVLSEPYPYLVKDLTAEVRVRGNIPSSSLSVQFWVSTPDGDYINMGESDLPALEEGEVESVTVDYITSEEGMHRFYVYLYDGENLVDSATDRVLVTKE